MLVRERALCCLVDKLQLLLEGRGRRMVGPQNFKLENRAQTLVV